MATIKDLIALDFSKSKADNTSALKTAIDKIIEDYNQEEDKEFFEKEAAKNIDALYSMVEEYAPEAIPKADKEKSEAKGKEKAVKASPDNSDGLREARKPNKQLSKNGNSKKSKTRPGLTKALIRDVIDELTDLGIDLKGESEIVIASARMDLEEALDSNDDELENLVKEAVQNFRDWLDEIREDPKATPAIALVNKLIIALGEKTIPEVVPSKREKSKQFMEKLEGIEGDIEACRAVIREHNRKKREAEGPKPKKTRYTQLREKLLAVISIIPDKLKDDQEVQQKTEGILLHTHRELVRAWGMSKVKAKAGANAIKEKFDALEEKTAKDERKAILAKWKKDLPDVDKLVPKIIKDKQTLKEAAIEVINHLKQAIIYFEEDPAKAAKYLKTHFDQEQLEKHLPKYVKEALKL